MYIDLNLEHIIIKYFYKYGIRTALTFESQHAFLRSDAIAYVSGRSPEGDPGCGGPFQGHHHNMDTSRAGKF